MSDSMQDIISDVRHSADVDRYTKEQRKFLWSIADRLEAARESEGGGVVEIGEILHDYERVSVCWTINPKYGQFEPGAKVYVGRPPKQQSEVPSMGSHEINEASWRFIEALPQGDFRAAVAHSPHIKPAIHAAAEYLFSTTPQPDKWIPCSERLPTEDDGFIWVYSTHTKAVLWRPQTWRDINMWTEREKCFWTPANLRKPTPPEQESE